MSCEMDRKEKISGEKKGDGFDIGAVILMVVVPFSH